MQFSSNWIYDFVFLLLGVGIILASVFGVDRGSKDVTLVTPTISTLISPTITIIPLRFSSSGFLDEEEEKDSDDVDLSG